MSKYVLKYLLVVKSRVGRPRPYLKLFKKIPMTFLTFTKYIPPYFDFFPSLLHLHFHFYSYLEQINDKHPVVINIIFILLFLVCVVKNFDISKLETQKC